MIVVGLDREGHNNLASLREGVQDGYKKGLEKGGTYLEGKVVRKIDSNISPALHPQTIKNKGSSKSLSGIGEMRNEVTSKTSLGGNAVEVGIFGGRAGIGHVHEFGTVIDVTPKMRGYLHRIGIHLKPDTDKIVIPERSFLRSTANEEEDKIFDIITKEIEKAIKKK